LSATTITLADGTVLTGSDYLALPRGKTPSYHLLLKDSTSYRWNEYEDDPEGAVSILGVWGWHPDYTSAWVTGSTLNGAINASVTSITVTSGSLFSAGHLLKIDSEYLRITAVSGTTLTVTRGANGSTAAAHDDGAVVYYWQPFEMVTQAAARWAAFLVSRDGAFTQATFDGVTTVTYPTDTPGDVLGFLSFAVNRQVLEV
jgi:hypothetical protein